MDGVTETSLLHHDVSASYEMHVADEEDQLQFEVYAVGDIISWVGDR
jgi:hypothetical protein